MEIGLAALSVPDHWFDVGIGNAVIKFTLMMGKTMKRMLVLFASVLLASCAAAPQSVKEFRDAMSAGPAFTKQESHDINRGFSDVVRDIDRKSMECLRFGWTATTRNLSGAVSRESTVVFHPHVRVIGGNTAEMIMQMEHVPKAVGSPDGGAYVFLADIKQMGAGKTHMIMYGSSFPTWQPIFDAVKGCGEGKNVACPDSP